MISDLPIAEQQAVTPTPKKGSPWSNLGRGLTDEEWAALKAWRNENPVLVYKRRECRDDGRFFWGYNKPHCGGEKWVTQDTLGKLDVANRSEKRSQYINAWRNRKYRRDKEHREKIKKQTKDYYKKNRARADEAKKLWWRKKYSTDPVFRRKALDKCKARSKKVGYYCVRDMFRRVDEISGNRSLIRRVYKHASLIKRSSGIKLEVDHIIPIKHGGHHHELNLQILPEDMNRQKKDNPFWMNEGCYLDWRNVPRVLWPEALRPEYERLIVLYPKPIHAIRRGFNGQPAHVFKV